MAHWDFELCALVTTCTIKSVWSFFFHFSLLPAISSEIVGVINVGCVNTRLQLMGLALLKHSIGEGLPHCKLDGFDFGKRGMGWVCWANVCAAQGRKALLALLKLVVLSMHRHSRGFINKTQNEKDISKRAKIILLGGFILCLWWKLILFPVWKRG